MLNRNIPPPVRKISKLNITKAQTRRLDNGIPLHTINAGKHDIVKTEIILKSGKWFEDISGISFFTSRMLLEGTTQKKSQQISEYFESLGAHVQIDPGSDFINISVYVLRKHLEDVFHMIKECLVDSVFPDKELQILKDIQIEQIRINEKKNGFLAGREIRKALFSDKHPYGTYLDIETINTWINRQSVLDYYNNQLISGMEIIVSGKLDEGIIQLFDVFADLKKKEPGNRYFKVNNGSESSEYLEIDTSFQTSIRIARRIIPKNDPDHIGLVILNEILGGYFGSRLMKNIREDKGYTYGIYSALMHFIQDSFWVIGSDVHKESNEKAIQEIFREFSRLREEPVGDTELDTVKNYMLGSFLTSLETSFALAGKFKKIHFFDIGYEYYDRYIDTINRIDAQTLQDLAQKYLNKDSFSVVRVG